MKQRLKPFLSPGATSGSNGSSGSTSTLTPRGLSRYLYELVRHGIFYSVMIWGSPGIGKSSIVEQTARRHDLRCIDVRLSQLAPTDLRGLPVPENGISR